MPLQAVLGLASPEGVDWRRLRGMQYAELAATTITRTVIHAIAGLAAAVLVFGSVPSAAIGLWLAGLAAALLIGARIDAGLANADRRRLTPAEIGRQHFCAIVTALIWIIPITGFSQFIDGELRLKLWTVLAMLATASALVRPSAPMETLLFTGIVGIGAAASFFFSAAADMGFVAIAFTAATYIAAISGARRYLKAKIVEVEMTEKTEVVSMLLREYEGSGADWLWYVDKARRLHSVSPQLANALGRTVAEVEGKPFIEMISGPAWNSGAFPPSLRELADRFKQREKFSELLVRVNIAGAERWWEISALPKIDENGDFVGFRGMGSDVTEQREKSDKIAYLARYDTLTGLPNRMLLIDTLRDALRFADHRRSRSAFLMIDLDRFKAVNDTQGHLIGDRVLALVSQRLTEAMTDNELCGRLGGDEFAIVIRSVADPAYVAQVADKIIDSLSQPYDIDRQTLYIGASIGSALTPLDGVTVDTLMHHADLALYRAKDSGGGSHCAFEPAFFDQAEARRKLELALRSALKRDEMLLYYQPIIETASEEVIAFEALIRWNSSEFGMLAPAKFIPLAENSRLIVPIGEWVLKQACLEATTWPSATRLAINVSPEQLLDPNFEPAVVTALSASGLAPSRLELEITESIFDRDATQARTALERVLALGCSVALDNFGTGRSSISHVRDIRFSTIKIDRQFVEGAAIGNPESLAVVRAVVAMADSLDMATTAECVETENELDTLRALGCHRVQGHYFGLPMTSAHVAALVQNRAAAIA